MRLIDGWFRIWRRIYVTTKHLVTPFEFRAGETYAYLRDINRDQAIKLWLDIPIQTYVFEEAGKILGTYYIKY